MDGPVSMVLIYPGRESWAQIVAIDCKPVDPLNPYGALSSATITLYGWTMDVTLNYRDHGLSALVELGQDYIEAILDDADRQELPMLLLTMVKAYDSYASAHGLVLVPINGSAFRRGSTFRRIGAFRHARFSWNIRQTFERRVVEII